MTAPTPPFHHPTRENIELLRMLELRDQLYLREPESFLFILKPCRVKVLLVADGGLDFGLGDFGLRAFVETLLATTAIYVRFDVTVAHIEDVLDDQVMVGHAGIKRSIKSFRFDDTSHFTPTMYDQVWLFGIATFYSRGNSPGGQPYPNNRLGDAELNALSQFMDGGGGLFATGDHGALGVCLSGSIPRAQSMRLWGDTSPNNSLNEVSMSGPLRNDTTRLGPSPGSQFNDQSDDVPQPIQPKTYSTRSGLWRYSYPHPLLCGPRGVIRILPDHPHEGQCVTPANPGNAEYPPATVGSTRPLPEVIATSTVLSGTTSGGKQATQSQTFGAISAYDGHRAGVGRVVTDATWHHFVNVNLVGDSSAPPGDPKRLGFLATATGQAYLEDIKAYYRNIAVWLSRPALISCMTWRLCWGLLWHHRIMEAVMTRPEIPLRQANLTILYEIGRHARDVLGSYASQCQARTFALELLKPVLKADLHARLDPWLFEPVPPLPEPPDPLPWFDLDPILDTAVGGALVALREEFPVHDEKVRSKVKDRALEEVINQGVRTAVELSLRSLSVTTRDFAALSSASGNVRNGP